MNYYTLGIETSCDETASSVVKDDRQILSNVVFSQAELHRKYGGVVPEIASRNHLKKVIPVLKESLEEAGITLSQVDLVGVTNGPGLVGPLLVGISVAKAISYGLNKPLVGVNHLEAHIFAHFLGNPHSSPPFLALIVSGGHTSLVYVEEYGGYRLLGSTRDDAAGEAFDKVANLIGLGYPGGAEIDKIAKEGDPDSIDFPRPMIEDSNYDFSFAGLKTAVVYYVGENDDVSLENLAASFQEAVLDVLVTKSINAAREMDVSEIAVVGGVAANSRLRNKFKTRGSKEGIEVHFPTLSLCTDNGAMIAATAHYNYKKKGESDDITLSPLPSLNIG